MSTPSPETASSADLNLNNLSVGDAPPNALANTESEVEVTEETTPYTFGELPLSEGVLKALKKMGFVTPSPIQEEAIPVMMSGKDLIGQAQTGTGKTAAFGIPIIEKVDPNSREIQAAVVCPTRELALQVAEEIRKLARYMEGVSVICVYGGQPLEIQERALKAHQPQILIGTPGRLLDFIWRGTFHLSHVNTLVLDEADEMLNLGFRDDIEQLFQFMPPPRQTVFFSATMPPAILAMTQAYQDNPVRVKVQPRLEEIAQITQFVIEVYPHAKLAALVQLMRQIDSKLALVFCNTKHGVDDLTNHLQKAGLSADGLHGGKSQDLRERILNRFKRGQIHILVATDVAARGIDVPNVEAVVNYDLPKEAETYTHRIGRTGRAGQSGRAYSLVTGKQKGLLRQLQKNPNNTLEPFYLDEASAIRGEAPELYKQQTSRPAGAQGGPNQAAAKKNRPKRRRGPGGGSKPPQQGQSQQSS